MEKLGAATMTQSSKAAALTRRDVLRGGAALTALAATPTLAACGGAGASGSDGKVTITMWHGQSTTSKRTLDRLVAKFNRTHPRIKVEASSGGVLADGMLQKITAALAAGEVPDIAYIFGSDVANLSRSPYVLDLTANTKKPDFGWDDFFPAVREAVTIDGRVRALPSLVDSLCVVYNKKLFRESGEPFPPDDWTWDEYREIAKRMTDSSAGRFGTGWPGAGDEDTVWRIWPLVWDLGGDVVNSDATKIGFDGDSGLKALTLIHEMAAIDKSVYVDTKGSELMYRVFLNDKMAMVPTGPWELPEIEQNKIDYGVVPLPTFTGKNVTIAGPDSWTIFDNGSDRADAAIEFVRWLISPEQDVQWDIQAGSLPLSKGTVAQPEWQEHQHATEGLDVFVDALEYAQVRPTIRTYPDISKAVGQAIAGVLLGRETPEDALKGAAQTANVALQAG
jgi:multiple sugar transport system substrate-binding protein